MSLTAYIRYDQTGRIVPGGPIVVKDKPAVGNWQVVTEGTNVTLSGKLRAFVKVDRFGKPIASSLFLGKTQPATGDWIEVNASLTQAGPSTTTTTTTAQVSTSTTTSTTTQVGITVYTYFGPTAEYACNQNYYNTTVTLSPGAANLCESSIVYSDYASYGLYNVDTFIKQDATSSYRKYHIDGSGTFATAVEACVNCPVSIGQQALGGTIAYILQPGDPGYDSNVQHGLVATINDISTGASWGCFGTEIIGADGTAIGTGNQNSIDIVGGCSTSGIAAQLSIDLVEGGYSDWYLPSRDELNTLYVNRSIIGGFDTGQYSGYYWSSSEYLDGSFQNAYTQSFFTGTQTQSSKLNANRVRPVRSF